MLARLLAVWLLLVGAGAWAEVPVPALRTRVTDLTQTLTPAQHQMLERKLAAFEQQQGSQVAVLIVPTTQPETIEQYGIRVAEQWKLGRAEPDDGVLMLIAKNDRAVRLEVGYGLEGAIPDAIAKRIIEEDMLPQFRQNQFAAGINAGIERVFGLIRGEALPPPPARGAVGTAGQRSAAGGLLPFLFVALFLGQMLRRLLGPVLGGLVVGGGLFALGWLLFGALALGLVLGLAGFFLTLIGVIGAAPFIVGGGGFGRGGFGGGGLGGGFGGGGGGFGGGGASGRW